LVVVDGLVDQWVQAVEMLAVTEAGEAAMAWRIRWAVL